LQNKRIILALLVFLTTGAISAQAETAPAQQKAQLPPANMNDEALASYITGRLTPLLKDTAYQVSQNCDSSGCSVVVQ
jgi:hypothetical protein